MSCHCPADCNAASCGRCHTCVGTSHHVVHHGIPITQTTPAYVPVAVQPAAVAAPVVAQPAAPQVVTMQEEERPSFFGPRHRKADTVVVQQPQTAAVAVPAAAVAPSVATTTQTVITRP